MIQSVPDNITVQRDTTKDHRKESLRTAHQKKKDKKTENESLALAICREYQSIYFSALQRQHES
jgi:hypothetical protein